MVLEQVGGPLIQRDLPEPLPNSHEIAIRVEACAVCRTDLHILDGELTAQLPRVLGHQVVGTVIGSGERVGVPWLGWACGVCSYCTSGRENLCPKAQFTGFHRDGGFAEVCIADAAFALPIPAPYDAISAAPLLCGALIGYRALRLAGDAHRLGLYGFGSAAHQITQVARHQGREVFAFTRRGDTHGQAFARSLGATWAGDSDALPPSPLDAAIIFAPVGELVPKALAAVAPGGTVVCGGIHMSDIPSFPYKLLWEERELRSVANLTRRDGRELLALAPVVGLRANTATYALADVNTALADLRAGRFDGSAVVVP